MYVIRVCALLAAGAGALFGQAPAPGKAKTAKTPFQSRSASTISYSVKDSEETVDITNVAYEVTGDSAPGRPPDSHLVVRTTMHSHEVLSDKGVDATMTLEAWPLGTDLQGKPRYTVKVPGVGAQTVEGDLWVVDRSIDPDVSWWSVYKLGTGQHLFDTYVDLLRFSISRETVAERYAGLDVPPDDTSDLRLKEPHVIAVLIYASAEKVVREALITCDNQERATVFRSYADSTRQLSLVERAAGQQALKVSFINNYPSPANTALVSIPIAKDDLDLAHAEVPAGFHVTSFRR
ncbi:conserved exported hypothetical protein [Candidatus Sulfopaludibacter sp. SbA6]|nr:conserved exported hypothetical protein [Candidatus Sulfopaludibacter sp. SbA6]